MKLINHFSPLQEKEKSSISDPSVLRIVTLGRLVNKKGFHVLLGAFAEMQKKTKTKSELFIGGTGPEQNELIKQSKELGLTENVNFVGWLDNVTEFLQDADLFVLPSLDEPFGIVVLEAMALGLPIVSSDSQGPKQILDEDCAWLSKAGDKNSLAKALLQAGDNYDERVRKSNNALERFKQNYSKQVVIPQFIELFDCLLKEQSRPS
jgi:glycosyltransferase involved in cell wall biosynthesis